MDNFLVYRSSAGSGKTYTLMRIYLTLVLREPYRYRNILAITFTNKAANEIKKRILSKLKLIGSLEQDKIPASEVHLINSLLNDTKLSFDELKARSVEVLSMILHNYSDFSVSTIDSFVHRIIRAFSYDLKLSMNFEVEMDTDMLIELTVDDMMSAVGTDKDLTEILIRFISEKAEEDESWQIERTLAEFSKGLFDEDASRLMSEFSGLSAVQVRRISGEIRKARKEYAEKLAALGSEAMALIQSQGIGPELFYQKSKGIYGFFKKLETGDIRLESNQFAETTVENGKWLSREGEKSTDGQNVINITDRLTAIYIEARELMEQNASWIILLDIILRQLYPMSVLGALRSRLNAIKKERNVVPISEFNRIVAGIVLEEPVPFIYERIGERFRYYMIDEFQDTSVLQWTNLLPLLENSLSQGGLSMVVGDGKQAIYRFRNGDVDQFVRLPAIHNPDENPFINQRAAILRKEYKPENLDKNFRSRREIIEFNNGFFEHTAPLFLGEEQKVYLGGRQGFDETKTGGLVQIEFYGGQEKKPPEEYFTHRVLELVNLLMDEGYKPGDIAVLCRSNAESSAVAVHLYNNRINVVSADSLLLKNSSEVNFLINWLSYMNDTDDSISRIAIANYLFENELAGGLSREEVHRSAVGNSSFYEFLALAGLSVSLFGMRDLSLFDKLEELIRIFGLQERSPMYLQFFLDEVLNFSNTHPGNIPDFLEYWERQRNSLSVVLPSGEDAVQVMTIHKSKGLEFPVVIYPFATNKISNLGAKSVWVPFHDENLPELKAAYVKISKELEKTPYAMLYQRENDKKKLDLLNIVYVAFTRPIERLYVLTGKTPEKAGESITDLLYNYLVQTGEYHEDRLVYTFGDGTFVKGNDYEVSTETLVSDFPSNRWTERLVFASKAPLHWSADEPDSARRAGNLLHYALSLLQDHRDRDKVIAGLKSGGMLDEESAEKFGKLLDNILNHEQARHFFDEGGEVFTEAEILTPGGKAYRPDRVVAHAEHTDVIDFKSGRPEEFHSDQVSNYASILKKMGYPNPEAWLLYLNDELEVIKIG